MGFKKEKTKEYYLLDTPVENLFINEYMTGAPGDYVKVYLLALMNAELGVSLSNEDIAKQLAMNIEDVLKAWTYWENLGVIRKTNISRENLLEYDVEFVLLKEKLYGPQEERGYMQADRGVTGQMSSSEYRNMFSRIEKATGRIISGSEMNEIASWIEDFGTEPEVVAFAFEYCAKKKKKAVNYVGAVVRNWVKDGYRTIEDINEHMELLEERAEAYRRVFQALGFHRSPTEEERRIMDSWFDSLKFNMDSVLQACSKTAGISSPNINYVNKILVNWHEEKGGPEKSGITAGDKMEYYEALRALNGARAKARKEEVYGKVPEIREIDEEERGLTSEITRIIANGRINGREEIEKIKETIDTLNMKRAVLMTDNGFELDYMDMEYSCPKCKDTGMLETGERCQCFGEITEEKIQLLKKKIKK